MSTTRHALDEVYDEFLAVEQSLDKEQESSAGCLRAPTPLCWNRDIRLENLSFQYPEADRPVIDGLNLTIPKNTSLGIVGTTGSGKSTLVDLLLGLHIPSSGRILIDEMPLGPDNRRAWRRGIGYVPQEIFLIDDTIAANVAFGVMPDEICPEALQRAARAAQILSFIEEQTENGWDTIVGERGVRLSGGQRQRIGLARALYHCPQLLILDEATSALDEATEDGVMNAIKELHGSITMILIAHRTQTLEVCDSRLDLGSSSDQLLQNVRV